MVLVAFHPLAAPAGAPPSAAQYYQEALATMERLPTPPYLTYNVLTSSPGDVAPTIDQYRLRTHDDRAAYRDLPKGSWGLDTSHAFDPTWAGVYDFVQYGVAPLNPQASSPAPSPSPRANVKTKGLRIIAIVKAIAPSAYRISDRGAALCPDGAPGHALYLDAIRDPLQHMLTNVVIEAATGRFCSMRFSAAASVVAVGGSITIDLQFGSVGRYWLVRHARWLIGIRTFGVQVKKFNVGIAYSAIRFPTSLPNAYFNVPPHPARVRIIL